MLIAIGRRALEHASQGITPDKVHETLEDVHEAIANQDEIDSALATAGAFSDEEQADLEQELAEIISQQMPDVVSTPITFPRPQPAEASPELPTRTTPVIPARTAIPQ